MKSVSISLSPLFAAGALRSAAPIVVLILIVILQPGHSALTIRKHRTRRHVKNAAAARAGMNHAWREHSGQQTTTHFYRC